MTEQWLIDLRSDYVRGEARRRLGWLALLMTLALAVLVVVVLLWGRR